MQTECGHLFCRGCLEPILSKETPLCPLDNALLNKDDVSASLCLIDYLASHVMNDWVHAPWGHMGTQIFPDNACRREILTLEVKCDFAASGCSWIGQLKDLQVGVVFIRLA